MESLRNHNAERKLTTLIENKTSYNAQSSQLNIFETYQKCSRIGLTFDTPVIVSMLTGKKVMHLEQKPQFDFFPGESVVLPSKKGMVIDFPEASLTNPTQCIALEIERRSIIETIGLFNEQTQIEYNENKWSFEDAGTHLDNDAILNHMVSRIIETFTSNIKSKDAIIDLMIKELVLKLIQSKARQAILNTDNDLITNNRIAYAVDFIRRNFALNLSTKEMADKAYMSESHFYRVFKTTMGCTPTEFVNQERMKEAKYLLSNSSKTISHIGELVGFNSVSYFNRTFKKLENITPSQFRSKTNLFL